MACGIRLRQARYLYAHFERVGWPTDQRATSVIEGGRFWHVTPSLAASLRALGISGLDRLIRRYGPQHLLESLLAEAETAKPSVQPETPQSRPEGECRPKGTDEVCPTDCPSGNGALHGGDGNSGEVDAPAATASPMEREGSNHAQIRLGGGADGATDPDHHEPRMAEPGAQSSSTAEPGSSGDEESSATSTDDVADGDPSTGPEQGTAELGEPALVGAEAQEPTGTAEHTGVPTDGGCTVTSSFTEHLADERAAKMLERLRSKGTWGGWCVQRAKVYALAARMRPDAAKLAAALRQWITALDIGLTASPRLDGRRLVRERAVRRWALQRARRREDIPLVVLLTDVSGSCSAVCNDTTAACLAVASVMPDRVAVVEHSNGYLDDRDTPHVLSWLDKHHRGRQIGGVVAWGDWDAAWVYEELVTRGATLAWLDSWGARRYGPQPAPAQMRAAAGLWARRVSVWWTGVQTASAAVKALSSRA